MTPRKIRRINCVIENGKAIVNDYLIQIDNISLCSAFKPGANGIVFKAHDDFLNRPIAVKVWIPRRPSDTKMSKKALEEAKKIANLTHQNIVKIYAAGQLNNGLFYAVMELLSGETLKDFIKKKQPLRIRLNLWHSISDAMNYAYNNKTYHGDLHDGNIIVYDEKIKIIDFGTSILAKKKLKNPLQRESKLLLKLVEEIFPEYNSLGVRSLNYLDMRPDIVLKICDAIVEINYSINRMDIAIKGKDKSDISRALFDIGIEYTKCPLFNLESIFKLFDGISLNKKYYSYFLDILISSLIAEIKGIDKFDVSPDEKKTVEEKMAIVQPLLQEARLL